MVSTLTELLGFAALTAGAYVVGGLAAALFTGGACLLIVGYAFEDQNAVLRLRRVGLVLKGVVVTVRGWRASRREAKPARGAA